MLRDPRSKALVDNFASRWLELSKLAGRRAGHRALSGVRREPARGDGAGDEAVCRAARCSDDRSVTELLTADYSFLNERLATHYGIRERLRQSFPPGHVHRRHARRAARPGEHPDGHVVSATARRSSMRGRWLLANLLGAPPPPPPPDIPGARRDAGVDGAPRSLRERMEVHRKNPACASCHQRMDPLGFALENFDAARQVAHRRATARRSMPSASFPDGTPIRRRRRVCARSSSATRKTSCGR